MGLRLGWYSRFFSLKKNSGDGEFQTKRDRISEEEERQREFHIREREKEINK